MTFESAPKPLDPERGTKLFEQMRAALKGDSAGPNISVDGVEIFQGGTERPPEEVETESTVPIPSIASQLKSGGWKADWDRVQEEKNDQRYGDGQDLVKQMKEDERLADERRKRDAAPLN
ncbi:MAG: hypothetical protein PHG25_02670 [Candidatus Pacebacteria bacterium]|nr:hypothetical protein [Candidatus Paceibacterota bacterium]